MSSLDKLLAGLDPDGVEYARMCSFNCARLATGEIQILDDGETIDLDICDPCAQKLIAGRKEKGLDTLIEQ